MIRDLSKRITVEAGTKYKKKYIAIGANRKSLRNAENSIIQILAKAR